MASEIDKKGVGSMLGARMAMLRWERGLSQMQLAQRLHISASAVGMYEQGRRSPSLQLVVQLAKELGVTTDYLLTGQTHLQSEVPSREAEEKREVMLHLLQQMADRQSQSRKDFP